MKDLNQNSSNRGGGDLFWDDQHDQLQLNDFPRVREAKTGSFGRRWDGKSLDALNLGPNPFQRLQQQKQSRQRVEAKKRADVPAQQKTRIPLGRLGNAGTNPHPVPGPGLAAQVFACLLTLSVQLLGWTWSSLLGWIWSSLLGWIWTILLDVISLLTALIVAILRPMLTLACWPWIQTQTQPPVHTRAIPLGRFGNAGTTPDAPRNLAALRAALRGLVGLAMLLIELLALWWFAATVVRAFFRCTTC